MLSNELSSENLKEGYMHNKIKGKRNLSIWTVKHILANATQDLQFRIRKIVYTQNIPFYSQSVRIFLKLSPDKILKLCPD
jgi:hypothetical protein